MGLWSECVRYGDVDPARLTGRWTSTSVPGADGQRLPATPIITGQSKASKMLHNPRPYAYFNAAITREIAATARLLIIGYGFRDEHVNVWIDEHLRLHPNGRIAVVTKRTGEAIGENELPSERYLRKIAAESVDSIYESCGGADPEATHGRFGRLYLVATGMPMNRQAEQAVIDHLLE